MRPAALLGTALLALAACFASGCGTWSVARLENVLVTPPLVPGTPKKPIQALVTVFEDERTPTFTGNDLYKIPLVGALTMFVATRHPYPETTRPSISSEMLANRTYVGGDFTRALPAALTEELRRAGAFRDVRFIDRLDENLDVRRFDYIISGHVVSTDLLVNHYDYGLNFFNAVDFSFLPKLFGAPDEGYSAELVWQLEVVERASGKVVLNKRYGWGPARRIRGYYYGSTTAGLPTNAGLYRQLLEQNLATAAEDVIRALE